MFRSRDTLLDTIAGTIAITLAAIFFGIVAIIVAVFGWASLIVIPTILLGGFLIGDFLKLSE